jgi:molybdopterin converting factor subunit 1
MPTSFTVKFFASLRQAAGADMAIVELEPGSTVAQLLAVLAERYPELELNRRPVYAAVNAAYVTPTYVLEPGDQVALFPPVSGGAVAMLPATNTSALNTLGRR